MAVVDADFIRRAHKAAMAGEDAAEFDDVMRNQPSAEPVVQ